MTSAHADGGLRVHAAMFIPDDIRYWLLTDRPLSMQLQLMTCLSNRKQSSNGDACPGPYTLA